MTTMTWPNGRKKVYRFLGRCNGFKIHDYVDGTSGIEDMKTGERPYQDLQDSTEARQKAQEYQR